MVYILSNCIDAAKDYAAHKKIPLDNWRYLYEPSVLEKDDKVIITKGVSPWALYRLTQKSFVVGFKIEVDNEYPEDSVCYSCVPGGCE